MGSGAGGGSDGHGDPWSPRRGGWRRGAVGDPHAGLGLGLFGWPRRTAYPAFKAGVIRLTRTLAVEWPAIHPVNAVAPGYIRTEMVDELITSGKIDYKTYAALAAAGRFAAPDEVAAPSCSSSRRGPASSPG